MQDKLTLINRYLYRTLIKMFSPKLAKEFEYLLEDLTENEESLGRKIDQAHSSLKDTSRLVEKLESELNLKIDKVTLLKLEYERYSALAELEEDKARALLTQLDLSLNKGKASERIIAFFINLGAGVLIFITGIWASPYMTSLFYGVSGT
ncbi:hypothetical protein [Pseudoalteromonas fuliginea]|uniref:hypothetical protein n=1 Tax=Pseudoalteromonas fuliginea TaxID=1872678 RepID=UPI0031702E22